MYVLLVPFPDGHSLVPGFWFGKGMQEFLDNPLQYFSKSEIITIIFSALFQQLYCESQYSHCNFNLSSQLTTVQLPKVFVCLFCGLGVQIHDKDLQL